MKKTILLGLTALVVSLMPGSALASTYNGTTVEPQADGKTYNISAESGDTVTLANAGASGNQLAITFDASVNGTITVTPSTSRPAGASSDPSGSVNIYYDVVLNGLTNDDVRSAKWRFSVTKEWLQQHNVASTNVFLQHFNGSQWERLTTREISSTASGYTLEADVSSFSPFAVTAVQGLSNTGSPYMLGALLAMAILTMLVGSFVLSRKSLKHN